MSSAFLGGDEVKALKDVGSQFGVEVKVWERARKRTTQGHSFLKVNLHRSTFTASTAYCLKMGIVSQGMTRLNSQLQSSFFFSPQSLPRSEPLCAERNLKNTYLGIEEEGY